MRILWVILLLVSWAPAELLAKPQKMRPEALRLYESGLRSYSQKHFEEASVDLARAYELDPHPNIVYTWAQSERLSGNCQRAVELYDEYMQLDVSEAQESAARANIERCKELLPEPEESTEGIEDSESEEAQDADSVPDDEEVESTPKTGDEGVQFAGTGPSTASPWYSDPLALSLLTVGVGGLGVSGWSYLSALDAEERAPNAPDQIEYERLRARSSSRRTLAAATAGVGGLAIALAIVRISLRDDGSEKSNKASVGAYASEDRIGFVVAGFF